MGLHRTCREVRWLGSYPRADAKSHVTATTTDGRSVRPVTGCKQLRSGRA